MTDGHWTSVTNSRHGNSHNNSSLGTRGGRTRLAYQTNVHNGNTTPPTNKTSNELNKNSRYNKNNVNYNAYKFPPNVDYEQEFDLSHDENENDSSDDSSGQGILSLKPFYIELSIKCPFENCRNELLCDSTKLIEHLNELHKLRFVNLHHVYLILESYLDSWAKSIKDDGVIRQLETEIDNEGNKVYVIDPDHLPEDKILREKLHLDKLNEVLQIQAYERNNDAKIGQKCLFCKNICENRAVLFRHMFTEHNFNIGLPDNLVNVNKFLTILEDKLNGLQCLYCEKIFTTPAVLRKHMRKKKHFKINARNKIYDKFYVINYLEPGKNWETFENELYESDEELYRDDPWDDWNEEEYQQTKCIYCTDVSSTTKGCLNHMIMLHKFDLLEIKNDMGLDFYQTITLINYLRYNVKNHTCMACSTKYENSNDLLDHMNDENCLPKYLLPVLQDDLLLVGFEEDNDEDKDDDLPLHMPDNTIVVPEEPPEVLEEQFKHILKIK
ncbi:12071_t:CDS:2 [Funneliformis geosporum]|uniref:18468_t:CDS:1 n=1 Tax=Funneliformis geosporum TaxID=1117311 RepID=A0A9W4WUN1_9GLOM|nr:12071_t:CDS:2 [Funneliformis geosporum]CAI2164887.1 18468_t:CDS:2 [Funneliformis geosporum]